MGVKGKEETEDEREGWKEKTKAAQRGEKDTEKAVGGKKAICNSNITNASTENKLFFFILPAAPKNEPFSYGKIL